MSLVDKKYAVKVVFPYLVELRDSGETNMFGARPYLMSRFRMEKREADEYLTAWMESFK